MSAQAMGAGYFWPEASTEPPAPAKQSDNTYDFLQRRTMFLLEGLLAEIAERQDKDTFGKLVEVLEDLLGHCQWVMAEDGRRFELLKDRRPLPDES